MNETPSPTRLKKRRKRICAALLWSSLLILGLLALNAQPKRKQSLENDANFSTELRKVQIGRYNYQIPQNYFWGSNEGTSNCNYSEMGFVGTLPNFEGKTRENYATIFQQAGPDNESFIILFDAGQGRIENQVNKRLEISYNTYNQIYGPHKKEISSKYQLEWLQADVPKMTSYNPQRYIGAADIFYNKEDGKFTRVIKCNPPFSKPSPGCEQTFVVNDATIKITYRLKFLPEWKKIEDSARALFTKATIGHVDQLKPYCHEKL